MTPPAKAGGFSGNGTGNPHRLRLKAPSEPLIECAMQMFRSSTSQLWKASALAEQNNVWLLAATWLVGTLLLVAVE